jgi:hypothetical protein
MSAARSNGSAPVIALCMPTRGVGHLRSVFSALAELTRSGYPYVLAPAIGYPLPDANNVAAALALSDPGVTHLWFVEDDNLVGQGVLTDLLALSAPVAAAPYLLRNGLSSVMRAEDGSAVLCGFGCTLIRRDVFDVLPHPPFSVGPLRLVYDGGWKETTVPEHAGGHDQRFCRDVRAAGLSIALLEDGRVGHLELTKAGGRANDGADEIICHGGSTALPYYPVRPDRKERDMAEEWWKAPSGQTVLGLDPEQGADTAFYERNGWVKVKKADATPILKAQQERDAAQLAATLADAGIDPEPSA